MNIPPHLEFEAAAMKLQINQMSPEQLRSFACTMTDSLFGYRAFLLEVVSDYAKNGRALPFSPVALDPSHFNDPPQ